MSSHGREEVDMEVLDLQNDIKMKARSSYSEFWGLVSKDKFPLPTSCAIRVSAYLISVKWHFHT